jgi:hypothetical protein
MATLSTAAKNAAIDAITTALDLGGTRCRLRLYTASFAATLMNTHLVFSAPTWASAAAGASSVVGLPLAGYAFTGTGTIRGYSLDNGAGSALIFNSTGVGDVGSGDEMEMNVRAVVSGQILRINSLTLSLP